MTKTEWEIFWEESLDKFGRLLPLFGWVAFVSLIIIPCLILLGYNLRIHDNEKYVSKNAELQVEIVELRSHKKLLSSEYVEAIFELDEYRMIIDNLQEHPLALAIIKCESSFNGKAYNKETKDYGYWQINDYWHRERARKLGFDIENQKDNLLYGFELFFENNGLRYWNPSKHCWAKTKTNEGEEQ